MIREEIRNIKSGKKELRKFGCTLGFLLLIIAVVLYIKGHHGFLYFLIFSASSFLIAFIVPIFLKPLHKTLMTLSIILGVCVTTVILTLIFYLLFTPIGYFTRLMGKDFLNQKIDPHTTSYWLKREKRDFKKENYEKQF